MRKKVKYRISLYIFLSLWMGIASTLALSPTDNYRQHIKERRTGELCYLAEDTSIEDVKTAFSDNKKAIKKSLRKSGAANLNVFALEDVNGKNVLLIHRLDPNTGKPTLLALPDSVRETFDAHPESARRRDGEATLLDMELICHLPCAVNKKPTGEIQRIGLVTELKPEMEEKYRSLHQAVWPGVIDQITRSNISNWTTWCVEIEGKLYLISYFEYIGADKAADDADMAADPTTLRWWKITDACQQPLPQEEGSGPWSAMIPILHID